MENGFEAAGEKKGRKARMEAWPWMEVVEIETARFKVGTGARAERAYRHEG